MLDARPMKVALFLNNLNGGGGERAHIMLANGLASNGHDVELIVVNRSGALEPLISRAVKLTDLKCRRALQALPSLVAALRRSNPDVLVSAMVIANVVAALAGVFFPNLPLIAVEHGNMNETYHGDKKQLAARIGYLLAPLIYGRFSRIYCVDQSSLISVAAFTRRIDLAISVMPNAVIPDDVDDQIRSELTHKFFDFDGPIFLNAGRLSYQKNQSMLLRAFRKFTERAPAKLIILGEGPLRADLEEESRDLGIQDDVDFVGFQDPFPFFARADVFVLSSNWEALPTVVIEALYCGCWPVVTKASMGTLELVGFGRFGNIVAEMTPDALCAEMAAAVARKGDRLALRERGAYYRVGAVARHYALDFNRVILERASSRRARRAKS